MPRLRWDGHGVFRDGQSGVVAGPGPGRPLVHEVDEETARRFLDRRGWVCLDDSGEGETGASDSAPDDDVPDDSATASADFDASAFVDRTPMGDVISDLESGDYDEHLAEIRVAETQGRDRKGVHEVLDDLESVAE